MIIKEIRTEADDRSEATHLAVTKAERKTMDHLLTLLEDYYDSEESMDHGWFVFPMSMGDKETGYE